MRKLMRVALGGVLVVSVGCEYGPEHLNKFYNQRDLLQGLITQIETKHHLENRDVKKHEQELADEEHWRRVQAEQAEQAKAYEEWFASLNPDQRFQWMLAQQQSGIQREWMRTEKEKAVLTKPMQINVQTNTNVEQAQGQGISTYGFSRHGVVRMVQ